MTQSRNGLPTEVGTTGALHWFKISLLEGAKLTKRRGVMRLVRVSDDSDTVSLPLS